MHWVIRERRTARLVQTVYACFGKHQLTADDLWNLCRLTWITKGGSEAAVSDRYLESTKLPALASLLGSTHGSLEDISKQMARRAGCSVASAKTLVQADTGMVNFYSAYRNISHGWLAQNEKFARQIVRAASKISSNDDAKAIFFEVSKLRPIRIKKTGADLPASSLLSPLLACLDPRSRYPIVNGRTLKFLRNVGLGSQNPISQHDSLVGLIKDLKMEDAFEFDASMWSSGDTFLNRCKDLVRKRTSGKLLTRKDILNAEVLIKEGSKSMRKLHNQMTNRLLALLGPRCQEGADPQALWDVLIEADTAREPSILVEIKSCCNIQSARMAVGQLLDYRRGFPAPNRPVMAVLLPREPDNKLKHYLSDVGVETLWFSGHNMAYVRDQRKVLWQ